ncbi:amino acid ABC transporter ATP-binding protein, partial [Burkholderia cenocepacia]
MIRLELIDKSFGAHRVLSGIDLALQPGSVNALIGPAGSCNSTLLPLVNLLAVLAAGAHVVGDARCGFVPALRA